MTPLKGPEVLVRAVHHAAGFLQRPLRIVLAGEGPERDHLERLATELGAGGAFTAEFPGWVGAPARTALLARASIMAIPSMWPEPFGLVGLEAANAGVPSVAFDVGGIREWLTPDVSGRVRNCPAARQRWVTPSPACSSDPARTRGSRQVRARPRVRFSARAHLDALERVLAGARNVTWHL